MTSIIKLHALSGVQDEGPLAYMLQVDEFKFLLDCGWDEGFSISHIETLKKHIHQIDAVLLSYPDHYHLGALPYLVGKCGLSCPVYATVPVYKMGQMFMYDIYQSHHNSEDFTLFTLDDVDQAFEKIIQLKYSQTISLKGKGHGLQITPIAAGHMIGGTIWKIGKEGEEDIVYAVDYNHKKERHLNGCQLDAIARPHLLITDAYNATYNQARRRQRDEQLMTNILQTMRNDGNVLVAVDTAGRVLELAQLLDQLWRTKESGLMAYSLALLNNVCYNVVEFAKSQMEWMSEKIMRTFEDRRNNPFQFKHLQLCHSLAELDNVPSPKVVLASSPDLQCGFSRDLFIRWCQNNKNTIILTNRTLPGTLARDLIDNPNKQEITLEVSRRIKLDGFELDEFLREEKEKKQKLEKKKLDESRELHEDESSSDSEEEMEVDSAFMTSKGKHDLMLKTDSTKSTKVGFFKQVKKSFPMFPFHEEKVRWDDYGEIIRLEDYTSAEPAILEEETTKQQPIKPQKEKEPEEETVQEVKTIPTKCVVDSVNLKINANIMFIDFEGRSDGESMRKILSQIKPRELIVVHGSPEATKSLADYCEHSGIVSGKIHTPMLNEMLDCTKEGSIFQVRLQDSVMSALTFSKTKDAEMAWIQAAIDKSVAKTDTSARQDEGNSKDDDREDKMAVDDQLTDQTPTLVALSNQMEQCAGHEAVFIGELKLSDFKLALIKAGVQAEFAGGVLICNGTIAIKKNEAGKIQIEGALSHDYYQVRELLYEQFAIV